MAKNALKMVEIFWGASRRINNNIFNIFCFSTFSFGNFTNPVFWPNLEKIALKTRSRKYPKEKVYKQKMLEMLLFIRWEAPQKILTIFKPFLAIFTLFHLKKWPYLQKPEFGNLAKTRFWFLLVNNSLCSIPLSWARSYIKETLGDRCECKAFIFHHLSHYVNLGFIESPFQKLWKCYCGQGLNVTLLTPSHDQKGIWAIEWVFR